GVRRFEIVNHSVRTGPIAFCIPPKRGKRSGQLTRQLTERDRSPKLIGRHGSLVSPLLDLCNQHTAPKTCDLDHFPAKTILLRMNHRSDELSKGSARGL